MYTSADLHIHTSNSDGTKSFDEIQNFCEKKFNNCIFGITDHNYLTLEKLIKTQNNLYIPGIEISSEINGKSIHITGYSLEPKMHKSLITMLKKINEGYQKRAIKIHKKLKKLGYKLPEFKNIRKQELPGPIYTYDFVSHLKNILKIKDENEVLTWCKNNGNILYVKERNFMPSVDNRDPGVLLLSKIPNPILTRSYLAFLDVYFCHMK